MRMLTFATLGLALVGPGAPASARPPRAAAVAPPPSQFGRASEDNLKAMARPADLVAPAADSAGNGRLDAAAVTRLLDGKVIDLKREGAAAGDSNAGPQ